MKGNRPIRIFFIFVGIFHPTAIANDTYNTSGITNEALNNQDVNDVKNRKTNNINVFGDRFEDVVNGTGYVDRTLLIEKLISGPNDRLLITVPAKFGKTFNTNMLKRFFQIDPNYDGKRSSENYRLFSNSNLIRTYPSIVAEHFGRYPVIHVRFNDENDIRDVRLTCKRAVHEAFLEHEYLTESPNLTEWERIEFTNWIDRDRYRKLKRSLLAYSLQLLSNLLYKHFGRDAVLLVDDYDLVFRRSISNSDIPLEDTVNAVVDLIWGVVKRDDPHIRLSVTVGTTNLLGTELNVNRRVSVHPYVSYRDNSLFDRFYNGFSYEEVSLLFSRNVPKLSWTLKKCAGTFYGGYYSKIYNPWSVLRFLSSKRLDRYIPHSVWTDRLIKYALTLTDVKLKFERLLQDKSLSIIYSACDSSENRRYLRNLAIFSPADGVSSDIFFSHLLELGYLTRIRSNNPPEIDTIIPNEEMKSELVRLLNDHYKLLDVSLIDEFRQFFDDLSSEDVIVKTEFDTIIDDFRDILERLFETAFAATYEDDYVERSEWGLHSLMFYLIYRTTYAFSSEVYDNRGWKLKARTDITMFKDGLAVILDVTYAGNSKDVLNRILTENYADIFTNKTIFPFGIDRYLLIGLNMDENRKPTLSYLIND